MASNSLIVFVLLYLQPSCYREAVQRLISRGDNHEHYSSSREELFPSVNYSYCSKPVGWNYLAYSWW